MPRVENRVTINTAFHIRCQVMLGYEDDSEAAMMRRRQAAPDHRRAGDGALAATRVRAVIAAILTSISLTGFSVQAWVT
jgi:hypothetical protein